MQAQNAMGETALLIASLCVDLEIVEALLEADADVEIPDNGSFTQLFVASREGHIGVVAALPAAGAEVDRPRDTDTDATPIVIAPQEGHIDAVPLIETVVFVHMPIDAGATHLFITSERGHLHLVAVLIEAGLMWICRNTMVRHHFI